jgi:hypothetical protein
MKKTTAAAGFPGSLTMNSHDVPRQSHDFDN